MRTTLNLNDELLVRAQRLAPPGLTKTQLIEAALLAYAEQEARRQLVSGAAWQPEVVEAPRRKMS